MHLRVGKCYYCGIEFQRQNRSQDCCSNSCRLNLKRANTRKQHQRDFGKKKPNVGPKEQCFRCLSRLGFGIRIITRILPMPKVTAARLAKALGIVRQGLRAGQMRKVACHPKYLERRALKSESKWFDGYTTEQRKQIEGRSWVLRKESRLFFLTGKLACERSKWELEAKRFRERYQSDPMFCLLVRLRRRLRKFVHGGRSETTAFLIGCDSNFLRRHLEAQFNGHMSWQNIGKWHIDHIIPCSAFDLGDLKQRQICFHWSNLRPMWSRANMRKNDSIPKPQLPLLLTA